MVEHIKMQIANSTMCDLWPRLSNRVEGEGRTSDGKEHLWDRFPSLNSGPVCIRSMGDEELENRNDTLEASMELSTHLQQDERPGNDMPESSVSFATLRRVDQTSLHQLHLHQKSMDSIYGDCKERAFSDVTNTRFNFATRWCDRGHSTIQKEIASMGTPLGWNSGAGMTLLVWTE